jgi:hypothetical protein
VRATYEAISSFKMPSSYYITHLFATSPTLTVKANNTTPCLPPVQTRRLCLPQHRLMRLRIQVLRRLLRLLRIRHPSLFRESLILFSLRVPRQMIFTSVGAMVLAVRSLTSEERRDLSYEWGLLIGDRLPPATNKQPNLYLSG